MPPLSSLVGGGATSLGATMRASLAAFALAFAVGFLFAEPADARPPGPYPLSLMLNGEASCDAQSDGGCVRLVSATTAIASTSVTCGAVYKMVCPTTAANFCPRSSDAGCGFNQADVNYGDPVASGGYLYFVADDCSPATSKLVYAVSPTGAGVSCPLLRVK